MNDSDDDDDACIGLLVGYYDCKISTTNDDMSRIKLLR